VRLIKQINTKKLYKSKPSNCSRDPRANGAIFITPKPSH
jgi:hypothetical protein